MSRALPLHTAYLALGGNLGDRLAQLRAAARELGCAPGIERLDASPVYETTAVAPGPQPDYLNAVVRVSTTLAPRPLLELGLAIEARLGRLRPVGADKAPRTIDLDLLLHGSAVIDEPALRLPHPGLLDRPFVRIPLAAVALPGLRHPVTGEALDQAADDPGVRRFATDWL